MKKVLKYLFLLIVMLNVPVFFVLAHPGRTDSNGCHTCRTNCASWGLSNGQYHCHNGGSSNSYSSSNTYTTTTTTTTKRVYGCTNTEAINYNSTANISDGTCKFEKFETKTEIINYETKIDGNFKNGKEKIVAEGKNGEKQIVTKIITDESGNEVSKEVISQSVIKEPITKIIVYESIKTKERKINSTKQSRVDNSINENVDNEESSDTPFIITILLLIVNIVYGNKYSDCSLIINKIKNIKSVFKYILYFLYFIFVIPVFIDIVLIIIYIIKSSK